MSKWWIVLTSVIMLFGMTIIAFAEVDTSKAVIHHTASPDWSVDRIRQIHVNERGFDDVGYHFVIRQDGTVEEGRSLEKTGAHARGRNSWVGIALTGYDAFSENQLESLVELLKRLKIRHIERHHKFCPSQGLNVEKIQEEILR